MDQKEFFLLGGSRYFWAYSGRFMYGNWPHVRLTAEEVKAFAKEDV